MQVNASHKALLRQNNDYHDTSGNLLASKDF